MTNLVAAYQANDILAFERILRTNRRARASHARAACTRSAPGACRLASLGARGPSGNPGRELPLPSRKSGLDLPGACGIALLVRSAFYHRGAGGAQEDHLRRPLHTQLHRRPAEEHPHAGAAGPPSVAPPAARPHARRGGGCTPLGPLGRVTIAANKLQPLYVSGAEYQHRVEAA